MYEVIYDCPKLIDAEIITDAYKLYAVVFRILRWYQNGKGLDLIVVLDVSISNNWRMYNHKNDTFQDQEKATRDTGVND